MPKTLALVAVSLLLLACSDDETSTTGAGATTAGGSGGMGGTAAVGGMGGAGGTGGAGGAAATCDDPPFVAVAQDAGPFGSGFVYLAQSTLGDPVDVFTFEIAGGAPDVGTLTITADGYDTCQSCVLLHRGCDGFLANCEKTLLARAGTLAITSSGTTGMTFAGTLSDVELVEVTIDGASNASTPVTGGESLCWPSYAFEAEIQ